MTVVKAQRQKYQSVSERVLVLTLKNTEKNELIIKTIDVMDLKLQENRLAEAKILLYDFGRQDKHVE